MNGIISVAASRSPLTFKQIAASVAGGVCLFSGFVLGMHLSFNSAEKLNSENNGSAQSRSSFLNSITPVYFKSETIEFSKINWLTPQFENGIQIKHENTPDLAVNLKFVPYALPVEKAPLEERLSNIMARKLAAHRLKTKRKHSAFYDLRVAYLALQKLNFQDRATTLENNQIEYQHAVEKLQNDFLLAWNKPLNSPVIDALAKNTVTTPGAELTGGPQSEPPTNVPAVAIQASETRKEKQDLAQPVVNLVSATKTNEETAPARKETPVTVGTVTGDQVEVAQAGIIPSSQNKPLDTQVSADAITTTSSSAVQYEPRLETIQQQEKDGLTSPTQKAPQAVIVGTPPAKTGAVNTAPILKTAAATTKPTGKKVNVAVLPRNMESPVKTEVKPDTSEEHAPNSDELASNNLIAPQTTADANTGKSKCATVANHVFLLGDNQICPEHKEWISKDWNGNGWVKVEGSEHLPTITIHPAPNHGSTLLLNHNALQLLALKSGIQVAKGTGIILGRVPNGYKVEFTGRAEETQYFDFKGAEYFAVLNAEPGASVVQLIGESSNPARSSITSTVFTPVLEDTITYLDLATPVLSTLSVQVVKHDSGEQAGAQGEDSDIVGLSVGLSTQSGFQAITQKDGRAILKNVYLTPGFPVFVDVSSKHNQERSYTYRYQLKSAATAPRKTTFILRQQDEQLMAHWLKQVKQGLSDQSAMIVGSVARTRLDGFKNRYFVKTVTKSATFGLEPKDYSILWDGKISSSEPLEGDQPYFMSVQVPEGLSQVQIVNEAKQIVYSTLIPVSPRVIHVVSE